MPALHSEAFRAYQAKDRARAAEALGRILQLNPGDARAQLLSGLIRPPEDAPAALALVEAAAFADPADPNGWYNLGVLEAERGALPAAIEAYRRAVAVDPTHLNALGNGAELLRRLEFFEEALAWADRRLLLAPQDWSAHLNRSVCLFHLRRWQEAEAASDVARRLAPERDIIAWERFAMLLFQKRFAEAWDAFEHRFAVGHLNGVFAYPFPQPLWRGEPLAGKRIIVHNEQGLGDQLMFACALQEVVDAAGETIVVAAPPLCDLFAASFPKATVLPALYGRFAGDHPEPPWLKRLPPADFQAPIGSLMAVLRRTEASFADPKPYLRPSEAARARWAGVDAGQGLKAGLCWASNPALFRMDSARRATRKSMPVETLAPLAKIAGLSLVSVLNWPLPPEAKAFNGRLLDLHARLASLDDTAALIERLDLVITVDTAAAHLAGALGKETWLLLHDFPDCRWELAADRSYWYPDVRLFRQQAPGDWGGVVAEVAKALEARLAA